jgi:hypothetical protein
MSLLPFQPAHSLTALPATQRWLIDGLWADQGVGIVGGEPKCCKSFLVLDMAVAVASKTPCLRRFAVAEAGPVLLYAAEDALHVVRARLEGICRIAGVALSEIDIQVITSESLRLDLAEHQAMLAATVERLQPKLLVLDPFVRLHRIDENASAEVAPLLAFLRQLQRRYGISVVVAHHAKKGGSNLRGGQALRGSSEFHAWGDSNLYLHRHGDEISLAIEHRAAPSHGGISLSLNANGDDVALSVVDPVAQSIDQSPVSAGEKIHTALATASAPISLTELRSACGIRKATLLHCLSTLLAEGRILKSAAGYSLAC